MRITSALPVLIVLIVLIVLALADVHASDASTIVYQSGDSCQIGGWNITRPLITYLSAGVSDSTNTPNTSGMAVQCPIRWTGTSLSAAPFGDVIYRDYNSTSGGNFTCHIAGADASGNIYAGASVYSCSTAGGCSTPSPGYTSPTGTTTYLQVTAAGPYTTFISLTLSCAVPYNSAGNSWLQNYFFSFS